MLTVLTKFGCILAWIGSFAEEIKMELNCAIIKEPPHFWHYDGRNVINKANGDGCARIVPQRNSCTDVLRLAWMHRIIERYCMKTYPLAPVWSNCQPLDPMFIQYLILATFSLTLPDSTNDVHMMDYLQWLLSHQPAHFEMWEETRTSRWNPCSHKEVGQTLYRNCQNSFTLSVAEFNATQTIAL